MSDDTGAQWGDDGLYVNFSEEEASTEAKDFDPLPGGKYLVTVTDCELKESKSAKNPGKPMYNLEFTVVEDKAAGKFIGRKTWGIACLFSPALYSIEQIMKAIEFAGAGQSGRKRVPNPEELIGQTLVIGGILKGARKDDNDPSKEYPPRYEIKGYFHRRVWNQTGGVMSGKSGGEKSSLLS